ncbi:bifunctional folylpolyglutamate synthase/dihydrofolate synthase [Halonatronum saccharophilum]|uniref:bifunctional folylpolyglutamate synthase/dihydrofolate synthase n=1 Tax=Halonatronum saccharophilum TaxID=150060 RepID=UPI000481A52C|nr:folylpolyglutamate synthase/dihydrofolate synthase family protein [Halonatronum saccharophilum]
MSGIDYLNSLDKFGVKPGLERIELLLEVLDNPQDDLNIIHIGGSNGKGSTSAILTSIYNSGDYRVGSYNSPHIVKFNERIRINEVDILDEDLDRLVKEIKPAIDEVANELDHPSFFEVVTALALLYFREKKVDLVVLEVGLGGRFDATNVGSSLVSVITNVSLEHTEYLGDTLEKIAWEKGGIIKAGQKVITASKEDRVIKKLEDIALEKRAKLENINNRFKWESLGSNLLYQCFNMRSDKVDYGDLKLPLIGPHQLYNTATALAVVEELSSEFPIAKKSIKEGIERTKWPGRLEVISTEPKIIIDGAHNKAGADSLKNFLEGLNYNKLVLVLAILGDKDIEGIYSKLVPLAYEVILTENNNKRAENINCLKSKLCNYNKEVKTIKSLDEALDYAQKRVEDKDVILVSGSLYTVSEARGILLKQDQA